MMVTFTVRVVASAVIRSIWWALPSTRQNQSRRCSGSRRVASSNITVIICAVLCRRLAASHLPLVTGPAAGV